MSDISQNVTIPSGASAATLTYFYNLDSDEAIGDCTFDFGYLDLNGMTVTTYALCADNNTGGFVQATVDLAAYIGTTVEIKFRFVSDGSVESSMYIDDVVVEVCQAAVLPIEWLSLEAQAKDENIQVNWSTAQEYNHAGFEVLRSTTANGGFEKIAWIDSRGHQENQHYSFLDEKVQPNVPYYYQIRQVSLNDDISLSNVVQARVSKDGTLINVYPNPTTGQVFIDYTTTLEKTLTVSVFDALGQAVLTKSVLDNASVAMLDLRHLASGIYFIRMDNGESVQTERVVLR